ncbi:hypothetical protein [Litoreibacter roseus]|uniref:Uncharacterized protein n=1 Tax=Litoreibacter roseus TaxID=2601869 RepID=A0A6N6JMB7_9RHOB|nr:hypothetical protein [Litoreibacter roseus]GFE66428.1 hypothetical protein KIN_35020 [Litoreibacter roseus]
MFKWVACLCAAIYVTLVLFSDAKIDASVEEAAVIPAVTEPVEAKIVVAVQPAAPQPAETPLPSATPVAAISDITETEEQARPVIMFIPQEESQ